MTVWVLHPVEHDLSAAEEFGTIRYIADRYVYIDQLGENGELPRENNMRLDAVASQFDTGKDYFLLVGDQLQSAVFIAKLIYHHLDEWIGCSFRVLRYDKKAGGYAPVLIQV